MEDLNGVAWFVRVGEAGSFAAAARDLGVTPSAVSKAVARLEDRLGVRLFNRTTRAIALSEDGLAYFERCRAALSEVAAAEDALLRRRAEPRGTLRVTLPIAFGCRQVAPLLPAFAERHPELSVEASFSDRTSDLVEDGLDLAVRAGWLESSGLIARKLLDTRFVACASPGYLARQGRPATPEDLERHACLRFVVPATNRSFAWPFRRDGTTFTVTPSSRLAFDNVDAMLRAAEADAGVIVKQDYIVAEALAAGRLVPILEAFAADGGPISAVYLPSRHLSPKVRAFVEFLATRIGEPSSRGTVRAA